MNNISEITKKVYNIEKLSVDLKDKIHCMAYMYHFFRLNLASSEELNKIIKDFINPVKEILDTLNKEVESLIEED